MGQMIYIDGDELIDLRIKASWYDKYREDFEKTRIELYPDVKYWIDTGTAAQVDLIILKTMKDEILRRRPFWRKPRPQAEV